MKNRSPPFAKLTARLAGPRSRAWDVTDRAFSLERCGREIVHLGVGDPEFSTPPAIVDAATRALHENRTHYAPIPGELSLRQAVAESSARAHDIAVSSDQVTIFPGAQCALFATLLCLTDPGDEVILLEPFYATYEGVAQAGGATIVSVALSASDGFQLDIARIRQAINAKTRVIIVNSPGNPSGAVYSESALAELVKLCVEHGVWLVSDEVYASLVFSGTHHSPLALPGADTNVVVISSVSKSHAMTGWRIGWTITSANLAQHLANLSQCMLFGVSQFSQDAATIALQEASACVPEFKASLEERRDVLCNVLEQCPALSVHRPDGGMFALVDVSRLGIGGEEFANRLLDDAGVAVVPGFAFGDSMRDFVRVAFITDVEKLLAAGEKIVTFARSFET